MENNIFKLMFAQWLFLPWLALPTLCEANEWVDEHNAYRCMHGMPLVKWSTELENAAKKWATGGGRSGDHDPSLGRLRQGENMAGGGMQMGAELSTKMWYDEIKYWENNQWSPRQGFGMNVGHMTQVLWKSTTEIGCYVGRGGLGFNAFCRYRRAGNAQGAYEQNLPRSPKKVKSKNECLEGIRNGGLNSPSSSSPSSRSPPSRPPIPSRPPVPSRPSFPSRPPVPSRPSPPSRPLPPSRPSPPAKKPSSSPPLRPQVPPGTLTALEVEGGDAAPATKEESDSSGAVVAIIIVVAVALLIGIASRHRKPPSATGVVDKRSIKGTSKMDMKKRTPSRAVLSRKLLEDAKPMPRQG